MGTDYYDRSKNKGDSISMSETGSKWVKLTRNKWDLTGLHTELLTSIFTFWVGLLLGKWVR